MQNLHTPVKKDTTAVVHRKKEIKKIGALKAEQQISFLCGTSAGSSDEKGPNLYLGRIEGMCAGQKRTNSAAKEHVRLQN